MKSKNLTILKGEGKNQHTLVGDIAYEKVEDFMPFTTKKTVLFHETPIGKWSNEHHTLLIPDGKCVMGKQCEYNPFSGEVTRVYD